jgi:hypothetical protein
LDKLSKVLPVGYGIVMTIWTSKTNSSKGFLNPEEALNAM